MYSKSEKYILYKVEELFLESSDNIELHKPIAAIQFNDSRPEYINLITFDEFKILAGEIDNEYLLNLTAYDKNMDSKKVMGIDLNDFSLALIIFNTPKKALEAAKRTYEEIKNEILLKDAIDEL